MSENRNLIFISYRRADSAHAAGRIYDRLVTEFGTDAVFKDVDSIPLAVDFRSFIRKAVKKCDVLLAIIGPRWADLPDEDGKARLHQPQDLVRLEIEAALELGIPPIPLLVDGASLSKEELPENIKELSHYNGLPIRPDPDFHKDVNKLITQLKRFFESGKCAPDGAHQPQTIEYPNGSTYSGDLKGGKPHGYGTIKYSTGATYTGEWKDGQKHGWGIDTDRSEKHAGEWQDGRAIGLRTVAYSHGGRYAGQWQDRSFHGIGIVVYPNGDIYAGEWLRGRRHGRGVYVSTNGTRYEGEWIQDTRHGNGTLTSRDGSKHCGEWRNDKMHGHGIRLAKDGKVLQRGRWEDGEFVGE